MSCAKKNIVENLWRAFLVVFYEGVSLAIGLRTRATSADWAATEFVYKKHTTDLFWMVLEWSSIKTNSICRRGLLQSDKESFLDRCKLRQKRDPVFFAKIGGSATGSPLRI